MNAWRVTFEHWYGDSSGMRDEDETTVQMVLTESDSIAEVEEVLKRHLSSQKRHLKAIRSADWLGPAIQ